MHRIDPDDASPLSTSDALKPSNPSPHGSRRLDGTNKVSEPVSPSTIARRSAKTRSIGARGNAHRAMFAVSRTNSAAYREATPSEGPKQTEMAGPTTALMPLLGISVLLSERFGRIRPAGKGRMPARRSSRPAPTPRDRFGRAARIPRGPRHRNGSDAGCRGRERPAPARP